MSMIKINKTFLPISLLVVFGAFGVTQQTNAATTPSLGAAESFSILSQTAITNVPTSVISGDVGMNTTGASITGLTSPEVGGTIFASDLFGPSEGVLVPAVQLDALTAYGVAITGQPIEGTPIDGALDGQTRGPGVYDLGAGLLGGGVLTLDGPGVYIFRTSSSLTSAGSINLINGARACDVYWRVDSLATINPGGPGTLFVGTIIAGTGIHFGTGAVLDGRALAIGGDVTMDSNTISGPTCVTPPPPPPPPPTPPTPPVGSSGGGSSPRPKIHIEKTPTPSELPDGPGIVLYKYIVSNIGTISIENVKITDDKCNDVNFISGDTDQDEKLDRTEEWVYECSIKLLKTTTNVVTAVGESSSGKKTQDTDEATVIVKAVPAPIVAGASTTTTPRFPNTGVAPRVENMNAWVIIPAGIIALMTFFYLRKRRAIESKI